MREIGGVCVCDWHRQVLNWETDCVIDDGGGVGGRTAGDGEERGTEKHN